jgi:alpha-galactosidase
VKRLAAVLLAMFAAFIAVTGNMEKAHAATPMISVTTGNPAMGYNTWYQFDNEINQTNVMAQAQLLVNDGLAAKGYDTVTLDDGWESTRRTSTGALTWNATEFPEGIPAFAAQLHAMGLKFGIYTAIGTHTCTDSGTLPGSYGHYAADANQFKLWGADFVKVDSCGGLPAGTTDAQLTADFQSFGNAIRGDQMIYSQELPVLMTPGTAAYTVAVKASSVFSNQWRMTPDEHWTDPEATTVIGHLNADWHLHGYAGPGHWNDMDLLVPGVPSTHPFGWGLSGEQSQLSVWAQEASPLIISTDLSTLTGPEVAALGNPDIIAIDRSGAQAATGLSYGHIEWLVKNADGGKSVLLADDGTGSTSAQLSLAQLGTGYTHASYRNVWTGQTGTLTGLSVHLAAGQAELLVLKPI